MSGLIAGVVDAASLAAIARIRLLRRRVGERPFWHGHTTPDYGDNDD